MNNFASSPERAEQGPQAEVLQRLSDFLEPDILEDLTQGIREMASCDVPGVIFEKRSETVVRAAVPGGKWTLGYGKTTISVGDSTFTFSDLLEVGWTAPAPTGNFVTVQASADMSGNHHPKLLIIEHPKAAKEAGGRICSPKEPEVTQWLGQFLYELALVDNEVYQFRYVPRHPQDPSEQD